MAFPPPTLNTARTNATPQLDTHPFDHNALAGAVNDIVAELGPNPSGGLPTVTDRLTYDNTHLVINDGAAWSERRGHLLIQAHSIMAIATDANGAFTITFPFPFLGVPFVLVTSHNLPAALYGRTYTHLGTTATNTSWVLGNSTNGGGFATANVWINYIAIGVEP